MRFIGFIHGKVVMLQIEKLSANSHFSQALVTEALASGDEPTETMRWILANIEPFWLAGNLDSLAKLLEQGSDPNLCIDGEPWLNLVLNDLQLYDNNDKRVAALKALVEVAKKQGLDARNKCIERLAFDAVNCSSYEFMVWLFNRLLQNGLNANATHDGMTLFMASLLLEDRLFDLGISRTLLNHGADPCLGNVSGQNGLDYLQSALDKLLQTDDEPSILNLAEAVESKTAHIFKLPPGLWFKVDSESQRILAKLKGWDKDAKSNDGDTPLIMSIKMGSLGMVTALLTNGASATVPDQQSIAPIFYALSLAQRGELGMPEVALDMMILLLHHGETLDRCSPNGMTPLMLAFETNNLEFIDYILSEKLPWSINQQNNAGETTAHYALSATVRTQDKIMASFFARIVLLQPDLDLPDARGITVRNIAEANKLAELLRQPAAFLQDKSG